MYLQNLSNLNKEKLADWELHKIRKLYCIPDEGCWAPYLVHTLSKCKDVLIKCYLRTSCYPILWIFTIIGC